MALSVCRARRTQWSIVGRLSPRAHALLVEWASVHADELLLDWDLAQAGQPLKRIDPLR